MGSPDVVTGRGVGSRAAPLALKDEQEPSHKWEELKALVEEEQKLLNWRWDETKSTWYLVIHDRPWAEFPIQLMGRLPTNFPEI